MCTICAEGAPSLRFLQGLALSLPKGRVAMLPAQLFVPSAQTELRTPSWFLPFTNCANDGAPTCIGRVDKIKSLGHPPKSCRISKPQLLWISPATISVACIRVFALHLRWRRV
jgi:hypothetical protein